jgi:NADH dehydrogenase
MIFLTGATGYVGAAISRRLTAAGRPLRGLVLPDDDAGPLERLGAEVVRGDLTRHESFADAGEGITAVVHAAALMLPNPPDLVHKVNVEGTANVLAFAQRWGARRLVYVSAVSAVYARKNSYGRSKEEAERRVRAAGLDFTILRPTMVYGPGGGLHFQKLVSLVDGIPFVFPVLGPGTALLQPVHIDDLVDAVVGVLDTKDAIGRTYGVSGATVLPFNELVRAVAAARHKRRRLVHAPLGLCMAAARVLAPILGPGSFLTPDALLGVNEDAALDSADLQRDSGYRPRPLAEGLAALFGAASTGS